MEGERCTIATHIVQKENIEFFIIIGIVTEIFFSSNLLVSWVP